MCRDGMLMKKLFSLGVVADVQHADKDDRFHSEGRTLRCVCEQPWCVQEVCAVVLGTGLPSTVWTARWRT